MNIPSLDLKAQYQSIRPEIEAAIAGVFARGAFILDEETRAFEREFADFCGVAHAIGVDSGTSALHLALRACGIGPGDEVISVSHTAVATLAAIEMCAARPVLVDIMPQTLTMDPDGLAQALSPRTRAIIPVHLYGCPANLDEILSFAQQHHLFVIEDCAQAHGATWHGKPVGSWGDLSAFSFYPTKNLGAYGDGGAILTRNPDLAQKVRRLRQYGWEQRYISQVKGFNCRLDELQAAILRVKLRHLPEWNAKRKALAAIYHKALAESNYVLPLEPAQAGHVYHQYVIRLKERAELKAYLASHQIQSAIHYPVPVHRQPAYQNLGYPQGSLPVTEKAAEQVLSLPLYPEMSVENVKQVCEKIIEFERHHPVHDNHP